MVSIFDVAMYILLKMEKMSTWKLQKLCYYCQAWTMAWDRKPLFPEEFEAWRNGPVCRVLYNAHKGLYLISSSDLPCGDPDKLSVEEKENVDIVLKDYGSMMPYELREQTHSEAPWVSARHGLPDFANDNTVIEKESIGAYYGSL